LPLCNSEETFSRLRPARSKGRFYAINDAQISTRHKLNGDAPKPPRKDRLAGSRDRFARNLSRDLRRIIRRL